MEPKIYTSRDHHIRNDLIDPNALSVLKRLHEGGYVAYLVGGGVRDLLMRKRPKDYDIATSALPEEVKRLFRNCILIGRRFRLAHIRFKYQIIEVSTFRAEEPTDEEIVVQNNIWGTPEEDVLRRDFTINGLLYDPLDHRIIDYVGGFEDLQHHLLRSIGEPSLRFKQDPVRMIRMQKFRARFDFNVEPEELKALEKCRSEITKSSPARILEEMLRMLELGFAEPFFQLLLESKLLEILFPKLTIYCNKKETHDQIFAYLNAVDAMNNRGHYRPLDRGILGAALVYPVLEYEIQERYLSRDVIPHLGEIMNLAQELIDSLLFDAFSHFPRKIRIAMHSILVMQYRLTPFDPKKRARPRIARQRDFIHAVTFLKMRALMDHSLFKTYERWKETHRVAQSEKDEENHYSRRH